MSTISFIRNNRSIEYVSQEEEPAEKLNTAQKIGHATIEAVISIVAYPLIFAASAVWTSVWGVKLINSHIKCRKMSKALSDGKCLELVQQKILQRERKIAEERHVFDFTLLTLENRAAVENFCTYESGAPQVSWEEFRKAPLDVPTSNDKGNAQEVEAGLKRTHQQLVYIQSFQQNYRKQFLLEGLSTEAQRERVQKIVEMSLIKHALKKQEMVYRLKIGLVHMIPTGVLWYSKVVACDMRKAVAGKVELLPKTLGQDKGSDLVQAHNYLTANEDYLTPFRHVHERVGRSFSKVAMKVEALPYKLLTWLAPSEPEDFA